MNKTELVLVLPDLANILEQKINANIIPPYLSKIINKASFQANTIGLTRLLLNHFSQKPITSSDLPIVSVMAGQEGMLRADPCYLHPDRDRLLLFADKLELTTEESVVLIAEIQPLLDDFGVELVFHQAEQWQLKLKSMPDVAFSALPEVSGKSVDTFLPTGLDRQAWIRLWNEIQMVLYNSDINIQRVNDGKFPINSVWFWGAGKFIAKDSPWATVQGKLPLLTSLTEISHSLLHNEPEYSVASLSSGNNLWLLEGIDIEADWQQQLQKLDEQVFMPLWQRCKTTKLAKIRLQVPNRGEYSITSFDSWKFW